MQQLELVSNPQGTTATSTSYSPLSGLRYQWQLQANLARTITNPEEGVLSSTDWSFDTPLGEATANNPWYYLDANGNPTPVIGGSSTPFGQLIQGTPGGPAFEETIAGTVEDWYAAIFIYHNGDYGFAPTPTPVGDNTTGSNPHAGTGDIEDPWVYYYADEAQLTLTDSVAADNPIGISFSGSAQGSVTINSIDPVSLEGNIVNPNGNTTITAPSITQSSSASITSNNLTLDTTGGVGTSTQPFNASLTANGVLNVQAGSQGVYLNLGSGALLGTVSAGNGDVVLSATNSLAVAPGLASGTVNVTGNNITLTSSEGAIGTAAAPLQIQAQGVVNVSALGDIDVTQGDPSLQVGQIVSTSGNVTLNVPSGAIVNASGTTWNDVVGNTQSQQVWQNLSLTNPSADEQQAVTAFENEVNADYQAYWQLLDNGSVVDGVLTLNAQGLAIYSGLAGLALNVTSPTPAQVQTYANSQYKSYVAFFNQNLGLNWMDLPEFQTDDPSFSYVATSTQVSNLESNAAWTTPELMYPVAQVAVAPPYPRTPVGIFTPNISGANVTLVSSESIGQTSSPTDISLADLQSGNLTAAQVTALADATAPGDVVVTATGVQVSPAAQLFVSATGDLNADAAGSFTIQGTSQNLTLNQVTAGGPVNITAQGSILSSGTGTQITTPGNLVLKAGTGTLGTPSARLTVSVGGQLSPYAPPGNSYLTVNGLTAIPVTLNAVEGQPLSSTVASHIVVANFDDTEADGNVGDFTATIDWGDGTPDTPGVIAYDAATQEFAVWASTDHVYTGTGTYTIAVTIDDTADDTSVVADSTAVIQAAELETDPATPGALMLAIGGTTGSADIVLSAGPAAGQAVVTLNGTVLGTFQPTSRTLIFGQAGNDQYEVDAPLSVPVFVYANGTGTNSLTVVGDGGDDGFTVSNGSITVASPLSGNTPVPIALENVQSVTINGGSGDDVFTIANTGIGTTTTVNSGTGSDTVDVTDTFGPLTVNTQTGTDTVNVQAIGAAASINAGGDDDTINVSSNAPTNTGTLSGIAAVLTVNGGSGGSTANVSDTGDGNSSTSTLSGTGLTSTAFGAGGSLSYSSLANLNISLGSGGNTFTVANTASGTTTTVNSGTGSDTVNVTTTSSPLTVNTQTGTDTVNVQAIGAVASINAGGGNDTINVSSNAPTNTGNLAGITKVLTINGGGTSTANVSDASDASNSTFSLTGTTLTSSVSGFGSGGSITYGTLANLNLQLGSKQNTIGVTGNGATTLTIINTNSGTTGPDTVNVYSTTNPLVVNDDTGSDTNNVQSIGAVATINGFSGGADITNVSSNAPTNTGNLAGITKVLTINGGGTSTANVSETGDSTASTSTLSGTALTSTAFGTGGSLSYSSLANLNINMGSGGNTSSSATPRARRRPPRPGRRPSSIAAPAPTP